MNLSEKERSLLACVEHQADVEISIIQKQTKLQSHTISYYLNRLRERQVILGRSAFINLYPLGYTDYTIYFSVSAQSQKSSREITQQFIRSKSISWVAKLGGEYQIGLAICAKRVEDVYLLMSEIENKYGEFIHQKSISVRLSFNAFGRKYLSNKIKPSTVLSVKRLGVDLEVTDELDRKILSTMSNNEYSSNRELARIAEIPFSTLERRLQRLKKTGIVAGYIYRLNFSQFNIQTYRLLIYSRGVGLEFSKELYRYAKNHPNILHYIECLGAWDFELGVEVERSEEVTEIIQNLYAHFGNKINEVKILQIFQHLKYSAYPF